MMEVIESRIRTRGEIAPRIASVCIRRRNDSGAINREIKEENK